MKTSNSQQLLYRFRDGQVGTVRWETDSAIGWGIMTCANGAQFTVSRDEVERINSIRENHK